MISQMDQAFKQNMGENLVGLRLSVGQVLQLVQGKASKQDVMEMVLESVKAGHHGGGAGGDDDGGGSVAGMVKCISCGYNYAPKVCSCLHTRKCFCLPPWCALPD